MCVCVGMGMCDRHCVIEVGDSGATIEVLADEAVVHVNGSATQGEAKGEGLALLQQHFCK